MSCLECHLFLIIGIEKSTDGKIIFLEVGNSKAGFIHILEEHGDDFVRAGIPEEQIADTVLKAAKEGKITGMQGKRPIYEVVFNGQIRHIAITVGDNGFIVGANPIGRL